MSNYIKKLFSLSPPKASIDIISNNAYSKNINKSEEINQRFSNDQFMDEDITDEMISNILQINCIFW